MRRVAGITTLVATIMVLAPQAAFAAWTPGSGGSGTSTARTLTVPTSVGAAATSASTIHVTWAAPGGTSATPTQYRVIRTAPTSTTVCTVAGGVFACDDTGLTAGTTYTYTVTALVGTNWTSVPSVGVTATTTAPGPFLVTTSGGGTQTAGTAFTATITATTDGVTTDTSYTGVKTITFAGPDASPSGTNPTYPVTVTFTNGVGTASITLYAAETTALTATQGARNGSTSVTVTAGAATQLRYTSSSHSCTSGSVTVGNGGTFSSKVSQYDAQQNPVPQPGSARIVSISRAPGIGNLNPASVAIAVGNSESSGATNLTIPNGNPADITLTASATGLTSATCIVKKN